MAPEQLAGWKAYAAMIRRDPPGPDRAASRRRLQLLITVRLLSRHPGASHDRFRRAVVHHLRPHDSSNRPATRSAWRLNAVARPVPDRRRDPRGADAWSSAVPGAGVNRGRAGSSLRRHGRLRSIRPTGAPHRSSPGPPSASSTASGRIDVGRLRLVQEEDRVYGFYEGGRPARRPRADRRRPAPLPPAKEPTRGGRAVPDQDEGMSSFTGEWAQRRLLAGSWPPKSANGSGRSRIEPGFWSPKLTGSGWGRSWTRNHLFGGMVGEFLARYKHIAVRHRFFDDEEWTRPAGAGALYFPEPASAVVASHGTPEGINVGGHTINSLGSSSTTSDTRGEPEAASISRRAWC